MRAERYKLSRACGLKKDCVMYGKIIRMKKNFVQHLSSEQIASTKNVIRYFENVKDKTQMIFNWFKFLKAKKLIKF